MNALTDQQVWDYLSLYHVPQYAEFKPNFQKKPQDTTKLHDLITRRARHDLKKTSNPAILLSGGTDSSLVAAILAKDLDARLPAYIIDFNGPTTERPKAEAVAQHLMLETKTIPYGERQAWHDFEEVNSFHELPYPASGELALYHAYKTLAEQGHDFVFTGDGGDELFMGYPGYQRHAKALPLNNRLFSAVLHLGSDIALANYQEDHRNAMRILKIKNLLGPDHPYIRKTGGYTEKEKTRLFGKTCSSTTKQLEYDEEDWHFEDEYDRFFFHDFNRRMPHLQYRFIEEDAKKAGIRTAAPLLDNEILRYAMRQPYNLKCPGGVTKYQLKEILSEYLPDSQVWVKKQGLGLPLNQWLREGLFKEELASLSSWWALDKGKPLLAMADEIKRFQDNETTPDKIFMLLTLKKWEEKHHER